MKKLMTMIAAVAMSFGLFADDPVFNGTSFEATEAGVSSDPKTFTPSEMTEWTSDGATTFEIGAYDDDAYEYPSEGPAARRDSEFKLDNVNLDYLKLTDGAVTLERENTAAGIFVDQLVKFTGFDEAPTSFGDAKIAIWKAAMENDDGVVTNGNLYVAVGDASGNVKNVRINGTFENETWYRLTIRNDKKVTKDDAVMHLAGFAIYINGVQQTIVNEDRGYLGALSTTLKATAANLYSAGKLFTSIGTPESFEIASVGYKGIGAIDDVIIDSEGPEFAAAEITAKIAAVTGATLTGVKDADEQTVAFSGEGPWTFSIAPGSTVTLTFTPAVGYAFKGSESFTKPVNDETPIDVSNDLQAFEVYATKVNGQATNKYAESELYGMINALANGDVVTFNVAGSVTNVVDDEDVTLYEFDKDTTITVAIDGGATAWTVNVAEETTFTDNVGVEAGNSKTFVGTSEDYPLALGAVTIAGELKADAIELAEGSIYLDGDGSVVTKNGDFTEEGIVPEDGMELGKSGPDSDDYYTYTSVDPEPAIEYVTFTVSYDDTKIENVSVKTNGEVVVGVTGNYIVESNAVVTIKATAKDGFKNVQITSTDVTVDGGVFTASKAAQTITITAGAMVYAKVPDITTSYTYDGTEQTAQLDNGEGYEVVDNSDQKKNAGVHQVEVTLASGYDAWEDDSTENKFIDWTINKAVATVRAVDQTIKVGESPAAYTATVSPAAFGSDVIAYTVTCPTYVDAEGEYPIVVALGDNPNYNLTPYNGTLKVEKAGPVIPEPEDLPEAEKAAYDNWYTSNPADPGDVALNKPEDLKDAYLLGCKAGEAALEAARKEFKFASIAFVNGEWVATIKNSTGDSHEFYGNGAITVKSYSDVECKTEAENGNFFKATLGYQTK